MTTLKDVQERCIPIAGGVVMVGGRQLLIATSRGVVAFEWHSYCGPMPVDRQTGRGRDLPAKHPFWNSVTCWLKDGAPLTEGARGTLWAQRIGGKR